jgi:hypothetical protein
MLFRYFRGAKGDFQDTLLLGPMGVEAWLESTGITTGLAE